MVAGEKGFIRFEDVYKYAFAGANRGDLEDEAFDAIVNAIESVPAVDAVEVSRLGKLGKMMMPYLGCPRGMIGARGEDGEAKDRNLEILELDTITDIDGNRWVPVLHPGSLFANDVKNFKARFEKVVEIQCQHGLNFCEHSVTMMEQNVKERYMPKCDKCCFDCGSLQTCGKCCPEAKAKKAELKAVAKQASAEAAEREAKRAQPYIDMAKLVYERVGIARVRNRVSVEQLYKAQKRFYNFSTDDKRQKDYERGVGTFSDNTDLPFGYSVRPSLLITIRDVADVLGCSVDYLLGRTDDLDPKPTENVSNLGTGWNTGEPEEIGFYAVCTLYDDCSKPDVQKMLWTGYSWKVHGYEFEPEVDGKILGWISLPKTEEEV